MEWPPLIEGPSLAVNFVNLLHCLFQPQIMLVEKLAHFVKLKNIVTTNGSSLRLIWLSILLIECSPLSRELIFLQQSLSTGWRKKSQGTVEEIQLETPGFYRGIALVLISDLTTLNLYVFIQNFRF